LADGNSSYTCSTTNLDTTSLTATARTWNTDTDCTTNNSNRVELDASSTAETLASGLEFTWSISGVGNPEWGWTRTAATSWDFDVSDTDVMGDYHKWSNKFVLSTHDLSDKNVVQKSYDNLNAAYLGFNHQYDLITVNGYDPSDMSNRVKVYAGSYTTDINIEADSDSD